MYKVQFSWNVLWTRSIFFVKWCIVEEITYEGCNCLLDILTYNTSHLLRCRRIHRNNIIIKIEESPQTCYHFPRKLELLIRLPLKKLMISRVCSSICKISSLVFISPSNLVVSNSTPPLATKVSQSTIDKGELVNNKIKSNQEHTKFHTS